MGECSKGCVEPNNYFDMPIHQSKGGKRKGAGRPRSAPTKTISVRVKLEHVEPIKALIREYLERF